MRVGMVHRRVLALGLTTILVCGLNWSASAEIRISPGDTVEIVVAGSPERYRAPVQIDGSINLPGIGSVAVEGLTPAGFQARMETLLPTKVFRIQTTDGRERTLLVRPADVTTSVAEFRPVYISGDVLTPGQQPYRPLMTVRQVVAVAGGFSMLRSRATLAGADPVELRREYEAASIEYVKEFVHTARMRAELQDKDKFEQEVPRDVPVPDAVVASIVEFEAKLLRIGRTDYLAEQAFVTEAIKKGDEQLVVLKAQEESERKGVETDEQELDRANKLFSTGALVSQRVTESRRSLLLSSTRHLQTTVEVLRLERQQDEQRRQLVRAATQRNIRTLTDLNDANVRLAGLYSRLNAVRQRLQAGGASAPTPFGDDVTRPHIAVMRKTGEKWSRLDAAEDFVVEPGDVIDVSLRLEASAKPSQ